MTTLREFIVAMSVMDTGTTGDMINNPKTVLSPDAVGIGVVSPLDNNITVGSITPASAMAVGSISPVAGIAPTTEPSDGSIAVTVVTPVGGITPT